MNKNGHSAFSLLVRQFTNPLVLLLFVAVLLSVAVGEHTDAIIILLILLATGMISFWQEFNAGHAMEKLQKMIEINHEVIRDGKRITIPSTLIVVGDSVLLDAGDVIPADGRLVESNELHVNESVLTGESFPAEKMAGKDFPNSIPTKMTNRIWQGTNVISGTGIMEVMQTGDQTILGGMRKSLETNPETAFEKGIRHFGIFLLKITVSLAAFTLVVNISQHKPVLDALLFSLALAVGMAPELLPAIMTFAMTGGARHMMKQKVIIRKLSSVFNFGEVSVLCTDKTGTITEGKVMVKDMLDPTGKSSPSLMGLAWLNASLQQGFRNPIDDAIAALPANVEDYSRINEVPYDFIRKRLSVAVLLQGEKLCICKGAFKEILSICSHVQQNDATLALSSNERVLLEEKYIGFSHEGFRVLGLCTKALTNVKMSKEDETGMVFRGFILLEDRLKSDAHASINRLRELNIHVKIITGDNRHAAMHIARELDMSAAGIVSGDEMDKMTSEALSARIKGVDIFAEIEPHQKERIVKALQQNGETVAYIGDGINDVSAIHAADVGISTNNAVDVARESADFVLLEKDLAVLANGVIEGRRSFANSMKYLLITTGATFGNMISVAMASIFLPFLPMLPKQLLLTNLISDLPFLSIASDKVDGESIKQPVQWDLKTLRRYMVIFGLHSTVFDFITFWVLFRFLQLEGDAFRTGWFMESSLTEIIILFVIRTRHSVFSSKPSPWLLWLSISAIIIILVLPFTPLATPMGLHINNASEMIAILVIITCYFLTAEWLKRVFYRLT